MIRILLAILLILTISACSSTKYVYVKSKVDITKHHKLDALTDEEAKKLQETFPKIKKKFERIKAALIANIKQLELNIETHNNKLPIPDT